MNAKKRKQLKKSLASLERRQLVALGKQKTETSFQTLLGMSSEELVELLLPVEKVLKPEAA